MSLRIRWFLFVFASGTLSPNSCSGIPHSNIRRSCLWFCQQSAKDVVILQSHEIDHGPRNLALETKAEQIVYERRSNFGMVDRERSFQVSAVRYRLGDIA
ncbi:hypothetical protein BS47DRAFT_1347996 [Hydnum rufescens UP504]|uniref:Secreted protein n=1 Tax=Hydnum rufescens UP504 TaxID=1448309 RepID=A0A9P6AR80_9AGAM|nr:hypothetical protein BS47DRAFT_1347996 [Hydnum rufescens UP504]